jgi:hypothetical protein
MSFIMPDLFNSPPLRISNIVHGRRNIDDRVEYLLDPKGGEQLGYAIPEQIVLKRWRLRQRAGYNFGGMRLSPNIWRSIKLALGLDCSQVFKMSEREINLSYQNVYAELDAANYKKVSGENILKLTEGLGLTKFQSLMTRHNDPARSEVYGTPDLYLWATLRTSGAIQHIRFVEVKKPREPLSQHQTDELYFLNYRLNIKARVLRLRETKSRQPM